MIYPAALSTSNQRPRRSVSSTGCVKSAPLAGTRYILGTNCQMYGIESKFRTSYLSVISTQTDLPAIFLKTQHVFKHFRGSPMCSVWIPSIAQYLQTLPGFATVLCGVGRSHRCERSLSYVFSYLFFLFNLFPSPTGFPSEWSHMAPQISFLKQVYSFYFKFSPDASPAL